MPDIASDVNEQLKKRWTGGDALLLGDCLAGGC